MSYQPGLHVLGQLNTNRNDLLNDYESIRNFINERINHYGLAKLGEYYHSFPGGGYTGIICLTESHISFHTWPEHNYLTLDIYLSNYKRVNDEKSRGFFADAVAFYECTSFESNELRR